jgi:hypothetical protein
MARPAHTPRLTLPHLFPIGGINVRLAQNTPLRANRHLVFFGNHCR